MHHPDNQSNLLILLTGIMAAGKSTVAQELAERFPRSVHLRGDVFRKMIVHGQAEMTPELSPEAREQLTLRYQMAAMTAAIYFTSGFTVIYQDIILGADLQKVVESLSGFPLHIIVLCPDAETIAQREAARSKKGYGDMPIGIFDEELRERTPRLGLWIDSSHLTAEETADEIITKLNQAKLKRSEIA